MDVNVSGIVKAEPEAVFAYLADFGNWPRWQADMQSTSLIEGQAGQVGARYRYVSKAMGQTFDSTVRVVRLDPPRDVAFEGDWAGLLRPSGRYLIEAVPDGSRVTLNPHPEARGLGRILAPLLARVIRRLNEQHLVALRGELERSTAA